MDIKVKEQIHVGQPIDCTDEQYHSGVRDELQRVAGKYIEAVMVCGR